MAKTKLLCIVALLAFTVEAQTPDKSDIEAKAKEARDRAANYSEIEKLVKRSLERADAYMDKAEETAAGAQAPKDGMGEMLSGFSVPEASASEKATLYIFISSSMPDSLIQDYMEDAVRYRGTVVMRGFVENSMRQTVSKIQRIVEANEDKGGVAIDPKTFEVFGVDVVPAIVLSESPAELCMSKDCEIDTPPFDKITGSVSVRYALNMFQREGDMAELSALRLKEGRNE